MVYIKVVENEYVVYTVEPTPVYELLIDGQKYLEDLLSKTKTDGSKERYIENIPLLENSVILFKNYTSNSEIEVSRKDDWNPKRGGGRRSIANVRVNYDAIFDQIQR